MRRPHAQVHRRVDYLVASALAVRRGTQAVRKARDKFGVAVVTPAFVFDSISAGKPLATAPYVVEPSPRTKPPAQRPVAAPR